jgi:hypothetical protein
MDPTHAGEARHRVLRYDALANVRVESSPGPLMSVPVLPSLVVCCAAVEDRTVLTCATVHVAGRAPLHTDIINICIHTVRDGAIEIRVWRSPALIFETESEIDPPTRALNFLDFTHKISH